jgi:RNA-binding protein YhbY
MQRIVQVAQFIEERYDRAPEVYVCALGVSSKIEAKVKEFLEAHGVILISAYD